MDSAWTAITEHYDEYEAWWWECPHCKIVVNGDDEGKTPEEWGWKFCPFCGARMGSDEE